MSVRLLSLIFKFGHLFGITPSSIHVPKISQLKKFYYLLIFVFIMYGLIAREAFHLQSNSRPIVFLYVINNIGFIGQNLSLLLRGLTKRKSWISFLRNLETTGKLTNVQTRATAKSSFYCGYLFVSILHLLALSLLFYVYSKIRSNVWREFYPEYLRALISNQNEFLSCVLVNMIRTRYKNLRKMVQVHFVRRRKIQLEALKKIQHTVRSLKVTVDGYNDLFGWSNLFTICSSLACLLNLTQDVLSRLNRVDLLGLNILAFIFTSRA